MGFLTKPPLCGSFEPRLPDGLLSWYFCWDDIAGRRLRPDLICGLADKKAPPARMRLCGTMILEEPIVRKKTMLV